MNRRSFLGRTARVTTTAAAAAVVASWPLLLRQAFAGEPEAAKTPDARARAAKLDGLSVVSEGYRRAQRAGKPLLVFIIPSEGKSAEAQKYLRGQALGAWLNHGTPAQLWPLALCEVVCATIGAVRSLVPSAGLGDPLMVLVETATLPATVTRLDVQLVEMPRERAISRGKMVPWEELRKQEDARIDANIQLISELVRRGVAPDAATLHKRVAQAESALGVAAQAGLGAVAELRSAAKLTPEQLEAADHAAALLAESAARLPEPEQKSRWELLHAVVTARVLSRKVPGSHWAKSSGCGTDIEDVPTNAMIGCGMGHVPQKSARFLYFFAVRAEYNPIEL